MSKKPPMVMPWHAPDPTKPLKMQDKAAFQPYLLDHNAAFDIDSPMSPTLLTKIICTIGPSSTSKEVLADMMDKGMSVARIDMRLGTREGHARLIEQIREGVQYYSAKKQRLYPLGIAIDLKGPEILTGSLFKEDKVYLVAGDVITLTTHPAWDTKGTKDKIYLDYKNLPYIVKPKDKILLDYGRIEVVVRGTVDSDIVCEIISGGELRSFKSVALPGVPLDLKVLSDKDVKDIEFAIYHNVDAVIVSFVRCKEHVVEVREALGYKGRNILVFSKIESKVAYEFFDEILEASDGIVVNRGAMSIEMSTEKVMQAQKTIFAKCNKVGKPVASTTEFLNSMVHKSTPTIAEVTDVATSVLDGADALILNDETSMGKYPALTVHTLATLCREAEAEVWGHDLFNSLNFHATPPVDPANAICIAAVEAALKAHAAAILVVTTSGKSAQLLAKFRPRCPILGITRYGSVSRQLSFWRGIVPIHYLGGPQPCYAKDVDMRLQYGIDFGKIRRFIKPGDPLVLVNGWRQGAGFTNSLRIVYASLTEPWANPQSKSTDSKMSAIHYLGLKN